MTNEKSFSSKFIKNSATTIIILDILFSILLIFKRDGDFWTDILVYQAYAGLLLFFILIFWLIIHLFERTVNN